MTPSSYPAQISEFFGTRSNYPNGLFVCFFHRELVKISTYILLRSYSYTQNKSFYAHYYSVYQFFLTRYKYVHPAVTETPRVFFIKTYVKYFC